MINVTTSASISIEQSRSAGVFVYEELRAFVENIIDLVEDDGPLRDHVNAGHGVFRRIAKRGARAFKPDIPVKLPGEKPPLLSSRTRRAYRARP